MLELIRVSKKDPSCQNNATKQYLAYILSNNTWYAKYKESFQQNVI